MTNLSEMQTAYNLRHESFQLVLKLTVIHNQNTAELVWAVKPDGTMDAESWVYRKQRRSFRILMAAYRRHERRMKATYRFYL